MKKIIKLTLGLALFTAIPALAAVPGLINFQGRLLDANKLPRTATVPMTFRICNSLSGSCAGTCAPANACAWTEDQNVTAANGVFAVQLGAVSSIGADVFSGEGRYLEIVVAGETLTPRERLSAGAYSLHASSADALVTPRAINGVNFDGSAAITVPVNSADDTATASAVYPLWTTGAGNNAAKLSIARLSFVPNTGILSATGFSGPLTGNVTGNVSGSAATVTGAAQSAITSVGTLTGLTMGGPLTMGANNITMTGSLGVTGSRLAKGWFTDLEATNPIVGSVTGGSGSAATLTTPRAINGVNFDGSAAITVPVNSADDLATASAVYPLWTTGAGNTAAKLSTTKLSFVPNTGVLTATGFAGPLTGSVTGNVSGSAATLATARAINGVNFDGSAAITVPVNSADDVAAASAVYPLWTTGAGNNAAKLSTTKLSFVPNTGVLTATGFAGPLTGSVTGNVTGNVSGSAATLATPRAINGANFDGSAAITVPVNSADDVATASAVYPLWTTGAGNNAAKLSTTKLSFVPATGVLTATGFAGPLTGNITGNASGSAATVTGAAQTAITSVGTLTGLTMGGTLAMGSNNITMTGSLGVTGSRLTKGWFTDLEATNAIVGSVTGNAATATKTDDVATASTVYPVWTTAAGNTADKISIGKLGFVPTTGILSATGFSGPLTGNVTGNVSGSAATVTGAAQTAITSVGTLTGLTMSGAVSGVTTLGLSGAITGATTGNTINSVIINAGAVSGVTTLAMGGDLSGVTTLAMNNQLTNSYANAAALNLSGAGAGLTFAGAAANTNQIVTSNNNDLALMPNGTGTVGLFTTAPVLSLSFGTSATARTFGIEPAGVVVQAGGALTVQSGDGGSSGTGGVGGNLVLDAGNAGGSGNNAGGAVILQPGARTGTGVTGYVEVQGLTAAAHLKATQTTIPTAAVSVCGTPVATVTGTDMAGKITWTAGGNTKCQVVLTFNRAYSAAPKMVILTPSTLATPAAQPYISATAAGTFTMIFNVNAVNTTAYGLYYMVIE